MSNLKKISAILSKPALFYYVLPVLMIYLVAGTIAQKYIGLYEATKMFFSAPILWVGPIPLPGLPILLVLIFINLAFKLFFKSRWNIRHAGIIITHIGALLLLLGGFFTALFSNEGYIDLAPDSIKSSVADYHIREFVLLDDQGKQLQAFNHKAIKKGDMFSLAALSVKLEVIETCRNCKIDKRRFVQEDYHGMAQHMELSESPLRHEDEENLAGLTFAIQGSQNDGIYLVVENVPKLPEITIDDKSYQFALRKQQRILPFSIELIEFKREMHPGTMMAKTYQSRVRIHDGNAKWESLISMNEPLRYKGYTFFQSSFIETPEGDISVLAVVRNAGRSFPYISGIAMCIGLIIHLFVRRRSKRREGATANAA